MNNEKTLTDLFTEIGDTDKHTTHSYSWSYQPLLKPKKESCKHFLEIGVTGGFSEGGGELKAFAEFFPNAEIHGIDIVPPAQDRATHERVFFHHGNGYNEEFLQQFKDIKWDVVLDDGPHTWESQLFCLNYFYDKIAEDGIILVEDVKAPNVNMIVGRFEGDMKRLSVINRAHTSNTPYNDEYILLYM